MEALVLNTSFEAVKNVDTFESFIWTDRYSECGDFELQVPVNSEFLSYLRADYYVTIKDSEHAMIIEDLYIDTESQELPIFRVVGRSLESILERRIIHKQTVLNGDFQNAIERLLDENVISPDDPDRKIDNFVFESSNDSRITSLNVSTQFTGDSLYDAIKSLCDAAGLGFQITLSDDNKLVFKLYSGVDRSYKYNIRPYVIFSPSYDNLLNSNYVTSKKNLKTITLVAGEGEGSARKTVWVEAVGGAGTGLSRRELYTDARDISSTTYDGTISEYEYNELLSQRGYEKLAECCEIESFDGQADPDTTFKYGQDYFMGDIVQIENEFGMESRSRITEVIRSQSSSGFEMYPTFTKVE